MSTVDHVLTKRDDFDFLKDKWNTMPEGHRSYIDRDLLNILDVINRHPSLVSVMSCSGHLDRKKFDAYIHFAVKDADGMSFLFGLFDALSNALTVFLHENDKYVLMDNGGFSEHAWLPEPRNLRLTHLHMGIPGATQAMPQFYRATTLAMSFNAMTMKRGQPWFIRTLETIVADKITSYDLKEH